MFRRWKKEENNLIKIYIYYYNIFFLQFFRKRFNNSKGEGTILKNLEFIIGWNLRLGEELD